MEVGMVQVFDGTDGRGLDHVRQYAETVERLGFGSLWVPDHVIFFDSYDSAYPHSDDGSIDFKTDQGLLEPLMTLLAAALVTRSIRLGTSVDILTERHPIIRGRELATLDHASNGRVEYGVGSGWSREEYAAMGITFERRGARLDEYIDALRTLWSDDRPSFAGEFVAFEPLIFMPKPVRGTIPIVIGGNSQAAIRRVAARGDGWHGWRLEPEELERTLASIHAELERVGRPRSELKLNVGIPFKGSLEELASYAEICRGLGIDELVIAAGISRTRFEQQLTELADAAGVGT